MPPPHSTARASPLAAATPPPAEPRYVFRLYIAGLTPRSTQAVHNLRTFCEDQLPGGYEIEVIDLYQQPQLAQTDQIVAVPTLIKKLPLPQCQFVGDLSDLQALLAGLSAPTEATLHAPPS